MHVDELVARAGQLACSGERRVLGIVGAPGAGKSTLGELIVQRLGAKACYVPMDGFHLANSELDRLGRRVRKGAPDTFDVAGYLALLRRLRHGRENVVYAPEYRRELEEAVAGAIAVPGEVPLVVTEGNYLLLDIHPWSAVRDLLDDSWYLEIDEAARLEFLTRRHLAFGKTWAQAREWAAGSDQKNADAVSATRHRADLVTSVDLSLHATPPVAPRVGPVA